MHRLVFVLVSALGTSLIFLLVSGGFLPTSAEDDSLIECAKKNAPSKSSRQKVEFKSTDRMGHGRTIRATVSWKRSDDGRSRVMLRVHAPPDLDGAGVLMIEKSGQDDMFIYLPDLQKVRRVSSHMLSGSLFGSDFTYEDFMQLQGMSLEGRREELPGSTLDGVDVRVLVQYPDESAGSAYERIVSYWDREACVPLRTEMYEKGDKPRKVLTIDRAALFRSKGAIIPQKLQMKDLRDETSTQLSIEDIEIDIEIPRRVFSTTGLQRPNVF